MSKNTASHIGNALAALLFCILLHTAYWTVMLSLDPMLYL